MNKNYYTLDEAASFLTDRLDEKFTPDSLLRLAASRESELDLCMYFHGALEFQQENTKEGGLWPPFLTSDNFRGYIKIPVDAIHPDRDNFSPFQYARVIEELSNGIFTDPSAEKVLFPTLYAKRIESMDSSPAIPFHPQDATTLNILLEPLAQEPTPIPFEASRSKSLIPEKSLFDFIERKKMEQPEPQVAISETNNDDIPGKQPRIAIGKLAIKAAWEIEREHKSKRRATANEVMERLQSWADAGTHPDVLYESNKRRKQVTWLKGKSGDKVFTFEACEKALSKWNESRDNSNLSRI
ncbi:MAG: hypothetical protein LZF85_07975 [Nitrosomonas sp.]|uniref:hypothetical protein n=1 Tax=Nitrosomonas sp. TaxID=42353 RepID=UPI001A5F9F74|nr:hypothetical protein [Nitrosomonas sp.]MBL8500469.1 hypothetical protein [Nitrosomonas sp.]UJP01736.1 MAG: hypothetical protein LZF85_07975 [Nitrosomonas sp.]